MRARPSDSLRARSLLDARIGVLGILLVVSCPHELQARNEVSPGALATAARHTRLSDIDPNEGMCRRDRTVERWLRDLTGLPAAAFHWSGGRCQLRREGALDAGGHWCGQVRIDARGRRHAKDSPTVEVYFERPRHGRPGKPYAFRGEMLVDDQLDYTRFPGDFEADWAARYPALDSAALPGRCPPDEGQR